MTPEPGPEALAASGPAHGRTRLPSASAVVACFLAGTAVVLSVVAIITISVGGAWSADPAPQLLVDATIGVTYPLVGALMIIAGRLGVGARQLAWVFLVSGLCSAAAALTAGLALSVTTVTPLAQLCSQLQSFLWVPGFLPLLTLVPLLYPDGLLPGRLWRIVAGGSLVGMGALTIGVALYDQVLAGAIDVPKVVTAPAAAQVFAAIGALLLLPSAILATASLAVRYRRSQGLARRQVAVLFGAAAVLVAVTVVQGLVPSPADVVAQAAAVALIPLAVGMAVTRHRLYDLDLALCRALVVISLSACLIGAYLSIFALVQGLSDGKSALSAAIAAGVTGAVLQPLGRQLTIGVDRLYFGHRAEPYVVTSHIATRLNAPGSDLDEVPSIVCTTVMGDLRLRGARVTVGPGPGEEHGHGERATVAALEGEVDGIPGVRRFELRHRGDVVGWLEASPRLGEQRFDERDLIVLQGVADQAAPAVAALHLRHALQNSRQALVAARESERYRLRQDLHDGLGATLAGLRLQVETARHVSGDDAVSSLLTSAGDGVAQAVAEVRTISEGLRPPGIDDLGLPRALAALASRNSRPALAVEVDVDAHFTLDPAIEVALYRIASEALANVGRHSDATRAVLRVHVTADAVEMEISDNGVGLEDTAGRTSGAGLGLPSMRQRAEEIGGRFEAVAAPDGGTRVRATLPVSLGAAR